MAKNKTAKKAKEIEYFVDKNVKRKSTRGSAKDNADMQMPLSDFLDRIRGKQKDDGDIIIIRKAIVCKELYIPSLKENLFNWYIGKIEINKKHNTISLWIFDPDEISVKQLRVKQAISEYAISTGKHVSEVSLKDIKILEPDPFRVIEGFLSL